MALSSNDKALRLFPKSYLVPSIITKIVWAIRPPYCKEVKFSSVPELHEVIRATQQISTGPEATETPRFVFSCGQRFRKIKLAPPNTTYSSPNRHAKPASRAGLKAADVSERQHPGMSGTPGRSRVPANGWVVLLVPCPNLPSYGTTAPDIQVSGRAQCPTILLPNVTQRVKVAGVHTMEEVHAVKRLCTWHLHDFLTAKCSSKIVPPTFIWEHILAPRDNQQLRPPPMKASSDASLSQHEVSEGKTWHRETQWFSCQLVHEPPMAGHPTDDDTWKTSRLEPILILSLHITALPRDPLAPYSTPFTQSTSIVSKQTATMKVLSVLAALTVVTTAAAATVDRRDTGNTVAKYRRTEYGDYKDDYKKDVDYKDDDDDYKKYDD
ncbi:hypothetical protein SODALDRAFT_376706, partial [Sodiomyces alkalinus F11]